MKDPRLAAALSAVFTGLGQMYNGQTLKGMLFSVIQLVNVSLIPLGVGLVTAPVFWAYAVYDAYRVADMILPESAPKEATPAGRTNDGEPGS
jgi:TM2 domain-containing membrane protein YozV